MALRRNKDRHGAEAATAGTAGQPTSSKRKRAAKIACPSCGKPNPAPTEPGMRCKLCTAVLPFDEQADIVFDQRLIEVPGDSPGIDDTVPSGPSRSGAARYETTTHAPPPGPIVDAEPFDPSTITPYRPPHLDLAAMPPLSDEHYDPDSFEDPPFRKRRLTDLPPLSDDHFEAEDLASDRPPAIDHAGLPPLSNEHYDPDSFTTTAPPKPRLSGLPPLSEEHYDPDSFEAPRYQRPKLSELPPIHDEDFDPDTLEVGEPALPRPTNELP